MKELSEDFALIFEEGREDDYRDEAKMMLESLDSAQKVVRKTFNLYLGKITDDN